jgi:Putative metal-binding motif
MWSRDTALHDEPLDGVHCGECMPGRARSCMSRPPVGQCRAGMQVCGGDRRWGACVGETAPSEEVCNNVDDNCDGRVDENLTRACSSACGTGSETCPAGTWTGCSAPRPQTEVCDLRDNNCDGRIDEGLQATYTFINRCIRSRVFVSMGCNSCNTTCTGRWLNPGESWATLMSQGVCYEYSAFMRTPIGDLCADRDHSTGSYHGPVWRYCNGDCRPDTFQIFCPSGY